MFELDEEAMQLLQKQLVAGLEAGMAMRQDRAMFAAHAMRALIHFHILGKLNIDTQNSKEIAKQAWAMADAMAAEGEKRLGSTKLDG